MNQFPLFQATLVAISKLVVVKLTVEDLQVLDSLESIRFTCVMQQQVRDEPIRTTIASVSNQLTASRGPCNPRLRRKPWLVEMMAARGIGRRYSCLMRL